MRTSNPQVSHYVAQFNAMYDGEPWYGHSIGKLLGSVTPAKAFWQPHVSSHSIAQIVSHMIYWRQALIKRLDGDLNYKPSMQSEENWKSTEQLKKEGWKSLKKSLDQSQAQLLHLLKKQKDAILIKKYSDKATFQDLINGILQHDLYHTGQIAYIKSIYTNKK